jgi:hypothetical protein
MAGMVGRAACRSGGSSEGFLIDRRTISTVGIVTRDRLPSLVACLESYLGNCQRHARSPDFVVVDDSSSAEAAERTRDALRRLADQFNARVWYAGRKEKSRFAAALAAESGVSREIIHFALFGDERCARSTGANRNSLLLDTAGSLLLSVDDDTVCRIAAAPEREGALSFFSGYDPSEFRFFPDRSRATQSVSFADVDVLGCHEALLGSAVAGPGGAAETGGRVAMTLHGLVGDSGMASPRYYLTLAGASRDRLVASPQAYRSALGSREILRSVRQPTITPGPFCMTTFLGLDNRLLLPPFFPVQRNSDGIFGLMLRMCVDGSHVAFLPWILLHAPEPPRVFAPDEMWADGAAVRMADIVIASVLDHGTRTGPATAATRLADLGQHLKWLGSLSFPDYEARIRALQHFRNFAFLTALHGQLQTYYGAPPSFWADDVRRMIELISKASTAEDHLVPRDLRDGRDADAARGLGQELVGKFGELVEAWPAMADAATRLRENGCRLAAAL